MLGFVLVLASFYIFVSIFSDGVESQARWKIFTVSLIATFLMNGISRSNPTLLGSAIACGVSALVAFVGLIFLIRVSTVQAMKITGSYVGFALGYSLVVGLIFGAFGVRAA